MHSGCQHTYRDYFCLICTLLHHAYFVVWTGNFPWEMLLYTYTTLYLNVSIISTTKQTKPFSFFKEKKITMPEKKKKLRSAFIFVKLGACIHVAHRAMVSHAPQRTWQSRLPDTKGWGVGDMFRDNVIGGTGGICSGTMLLVGCGGCFQG